MLNRLKVKFTNWFWKPLVSDKNKLHFESLSIKPFESLPPIKFDNELLDNILNEANHKYYHGQHYFILKGNITIEPSLSFVISGLRHIDYSTSKPEVSRPHLSTYIKYLLNKNNFNIIRLEKCMHFSPIYGVNYFHFFSDIINKIWLFEKYNNNKKIPLVINEKVYNQQFVKEILALDYFSKFTFLVQKEKDFILTKEVICIRPMPYDVNLWNKTLAVLNKKNIATPTRKIFLARKNNSGRAIKNYDSLIALIKKYDFEVVYTEGMPIFEQKEIFENTKCFISVHGAGNTNIMFCNPERLCMLEIFPENLIGTQYYWMARMFNIKLYDCMLSSQIKDPNVQFSYSLELDIDLVILENKIKLLVKES